MPVVYGGVSYVGAFCATEVTNYVRGDRGLLKIDWDTHADRLALGEIMRRLRRAGYRPSWLSECRSRSGRGWHVVMRVRPAPTSATEVVALQALLGSDARREACNLYRALSMSSAPQWMRDRWNVLYTRE